MVVEGRTDGYGMSAFSRVPLFRGGRGKAPAVLGHSAGTEILSKPGSGKELELERICKLAGWYSVRCTLC